MADARSSLPAGPFLLRANGKESRIPTLVAVRRLIASDYARQEVVVIDLASGRRIIFKDQGTSAASSSESGRVAAPAHDRPGFFLSAATELEVVPADDVVIGPPPALPASPPTPRPATTKPGRSRSTDFARPISPLPPRPQALSAKGGHALMWVSAVIAGVLVLIVFGLIISGGRHKGTEAHGGAAPPSAPGASEPHGAATSESPRSADAPAQAPTPTPAPAPARPAPSAVATPPRTSVGLVAHYRFDDAINLGKDSSGRQRDAISSDGVTIGFDPVLKRKVLILLGHGEVRLARSITGDFTISMWLNTTMTGTSLPDEPNQPWYFGSGLLDADVPGPRADFGSSVLNGRLAFGIGDPDTTLRSTSTISDGKWHFLTIRRAYTGRLQIFVDALLEATGDCPPGKRNAPATMVIGRLMSGTNYLAARLSSLRLYDRLLGDEEILDLLHSEGPVP